MEAVSRRALLLVIVASLVCYFAFSLSQVRAPHRLATDPAAATLPALPTAPVNSAVQPDTWRKFDRFIAEFRVTVAASGVDAQTIEQALGALTPDPEVLDSLANQPEIQRTAADYVTALASETRITVGREKLVELRDLLDAIEIRFGVDRHVILAIWGIESNFGSSMGTREVVRSLATLAAFEGRRAEFWRSELTAILRILQSGAVSPVNLMGSWAGGMGHTQFIPSAYLAHAIDFDNDGRRDIWTNVADALGSTGNYLKTYGWQRNVPWGFEVRLPADFDYGLGTSGTIMSWADWRAVGVVRAGPGEMPGATPDLQLLLPSGIKGPAFLVGGNFQAILRYNNATSYALAVGLLADRIAGRHELAVGWPVGERGLSRSEREELQRRLAAAGFDTGGIDGIIGVGTKASIRMFQKVRGLPQDGHADLALLDRLRQEGSK